MMDPAAELDFTGKTVVVTGSSRNIGRAIVLEFAGRGANVVINTRSNEEEARVVEREAAELGAEAIVVMGDAGDRATIEEIKRRSEERFGRVDISVSNAARRFRREFAETTDEDWHYYLNQQLSASWYLAKDASVCSTGTTASASAGAGAPVMIRTAVPGASACPGGSPAAIVPVTGNELPATIAPDTA